MQSVALKTSQSAVGHAAMPSAQAQDRNAKCSRLFVTPAVVKHGYRFSRVRVVPVYCSECYAKMREEA